MDAYLLDTNVASLLWDRGRNAYQKVEAFIQSIGSARVYVSVITLGEIERGLRTAPKMDKERHRLVREAMGEFRLVINIDQHTVEPYADIRSELFGKFGPVKARGRMSQKWPEDLTDRVTGKQLGIDENDIWIAAVAVQRGLCLVSDDGHMVKIQSVYPALRVQPIL